MRSAVELYVPLNEIDEIKWSTDENADKHKFMFTELYYGTQLYGELPSSNAPQFSKPEPPKQLPGT